MNKNRKFAFWRYDLFPFVLGAEIIKKFDNETVEARGYEGYSVAPIKIVSYEKGLEIKSELDNLKKKRLETLEIIGEFFENRLNKIMKKLG